MRPFAFMLLLSAWSGAGMAQPANNPALPTLRIVPEACPTGPAGEIIVCGTRDKNAPNRLPKLQDRFDPDGPVDSVGRERVRMLEGDESGIGSCSNRGPGGMTGCWLRDVKNKRLQHGK